MPEEVDVSPFPSLTAYLRSACRSFGNLPAFSTGDASMRYTEWEQHSHHFAAYLQNVQGLKRGDRIAIMMPNLLQYPVAFFGALRAGLVVVNINSQLTAAGLEDQLKDSGAAAIVVFEKNVPTLQRVLERNPDLVISVVITRADDLRPLPKHLHPLGTGKKAVGDRSVWHIAESEPFDAALRGGADFDLHESAPNLDDLALLQYTCGTTGVAKGVMLTHGNLLAVIAQLGAWIASGLRPGQEVFACPLPLYRINALTTSLMLAGMGTHTIFVADPQDISVFTHLLSSCPVTVMVGVNTFYGALLDAPEFAACNMPALKVAYAVGMAVEQSVAERWKKATGVPLIEAYALTECAAAAVCNRVDSVDWTGTTGLPLPSTEVAILDARGQEVPCGVTGEICICGPQVMTGYWRRVVETARVLSLDGWLHTGDEGVMDRQGYVSVTGRKKHTPAV